MAQNEKRPGGSAIDERTTRHAGDRVSQQKRKRIQQVFGWLKPVGMLRKAATPGNPLGGRQYSGGLLEQYGSRQVPLDVYLVVQFCSFKILLVQQIRRANSGIDPQHYSERRALRSSSVRLHESSTVPSGIDLPAGAAASYDCLNARTIACLASRRRGPRHRLWQR